MMAAFCTNLHRKCFVVWSHLLCLMQTFGAGDAAMGPCQLSLVRSLLEHMAHPGVPLVKAQADRYNSFCSACAICSCRQTEEACALNYV